VGVSSPDPSEAQPEPFNLGVLFVHGIGQQRRGATLVQFGDPLCEFLSRWSGSEFTLANCDLNPEAPVPAHGEVRNGDARWMLAECHWAEAFHEPSFSDLMKWAFVGIPWALGAHFNTHMILGMLSWRNRQYWPAVRRYTRAVWSSVLSAALVAGVAAFFPLLLLFVVVPVLRPAVVALQRLLSSVLGDSYLFVESPVQQAAIVSHFRRDLSWLMARTKRVAVVAHSQGAAVAYFGCRDWKPALPVDPIALVTFGSGLPKLQTLRGARALRWDEEHGGFFAWIAPLGLMVLASAAYVATGAGWGSLSVAAVLLVLGAGALFVGSFMTAGAASLLKERTDGGLLDDAEWTDVSATRDLVSNTSLAEFYDTGADAAHITHLLGLARLPSKEGVRIVENLRSRLSDHVSYLRNSDGFLPIVVAAMLRAAGQTLLHTRRVFRLPGTSAATRLRLWRTTARRRFRVCWRAGTTIAWGVVTAALLLWRSSSFPLDVVGRLRNRLSALDAGDFTLIVSPMKRAILALPVAFTGAVSICLLAAVLLLALRLAWLAWDVSDRWRFFDGAGYTLSLEFWIYAAATVVSLTALSLLALDWTVSPLQFAMVPVAAVGLFEILVAFLLAARRPGKFMSESERRAFAAASYAAGALLVWWPLFAGLSHANLPAAIMRRWPLPPLSSNPPEFWAGLLIGVPIWIVVRVFGRRGIGHLRVWSASEPS